MSTSPLVSSVEVEEEQKSDDGIQILESGCEETQHGHLLSNGNYPSARETNGQDGGGIDPADVAYSANSFMAVVKPVAVTMVLSAAIAVALYSNAAGATNAALAVYEIYDETADSLDPSSVRLGKSLANAFVIVLVLGAATVMIVVLYWLRCMKCLIGYMIFSSATLLGLLGGAVWMTALEVFEIPFDVFTYYFVLWNFAVVGVLAIFYQKGIPTTVTQGYLVATSIIMAWQLSRFEEWTGWCLLVVLGLYDLCAVLTPCGPLKALVGLMQRYEEPMPGLLYEAELPVGTRRRPGIERSQQLQDMSRDPGSQEDIHRDDAAGAPLPSTQGGHRRPAGAGRQLRFECRDDVSINASTNDGHGPPVAVSNVLPSCENPLTSNRVQGRETNMSPDMGEGIGVRAPQNSEGEAPAAETFDMSVDGAETANISVGRGAGVTVVPSSVELSTPGSLDDREDTGLLAGNVTSDTLVLEGEHGSNALGRRQANETTGTRDVGDHEEGTTIKLGLGDFVFYSVLVSKAALYGFTAWAVCTLVILFGLGATLVLLSVYRMALPALPISIGLGTLFYLLTRFAIDPYVDMLSKSQLYV